MIFSVEKLQEFLHKELGFDSQQITTRNFHSWNRFYADNDFIYLKPIKDRSPEGMMKILKGDKFRWQIRVGVHHDEGEPVHLIVTLLFTNLCFTISMRPLPPECFLAHSLTNSSSQVWNESLRVVISPSTHKK